MSGCLFCKIVNKEIPAQVVLENDHVLAFRDLNPMAPTHVLVIPKRHVVGLRETTAGDVETLGQLMLGAREVASMLELETTGYRTVINNGPDAGQSVLHLHVHVLGGRPMAWPPG